MEIFTDVPVPHKRGRYNWGLLEIGNSTKFTDRTHFHTIRNSLYNYTKKHVGEFTTRIIGNELWVWRVS